MDTEFEIKVLDIDLGKTQSLLRDLGFTEQSSLEFKRYIYPVKSNNRSWLRLRTDGKKTTLSVKEYTSDKVDGVKELEVVVSGFEQTHLLLQKLGHTSDSYQENHRTVFISKKYDAEISIDEWPHIPAYLEIEAKDKKTVNELLAKINTHSLPTTSAPTKDVYMHYGLKLDDYKSLSFKKSV